jgi:hypothetical protein
MEWFVARNHSVDRTKEDTALSNEVWQLGESMRRSYEH